MKLTQSEKDRIFELSSELTRQLVELGCDSVVVLGTYPDGASGTGFFRSTVGNSFAGREHARNYVSDSEWYGKRKLDEEEDEQ